MDFIQFIHRMQKKPESVRRRVLVAAVAGCMVLIIGAWLAVLGRSLEMPTTQGMDETAFDDKSPLMLVGDLFTYFQN